VLQELVHTSKVNSRKGTPVRLALESRPSRLVAQLEYIGCDLEGKKDLIFDVEASVRGQNQHTKDEIP
jgi:hypothetical protein